MMNLKVKSSIRKKLPSIECIVFFFAPSDLVHQLAEPAVKTHVHQRALWEHLFGNLT